MKEMSEERKCSACGKKKAASEMKTCMHNQMHRYVCDTKCMNDFYNPPKKVIAQPAEAEGVVIAAKCVNRKCLRHNAMLSDYGLTLPHGEALVRQSDHLAALSAVTAERDRLQQFEAAYNEWHDKTEWAQKTAKAHELGKHRADVLKDRVDQLQAEVERLRNELAGKPLVC